MSISFPCPACKAMLQAPKEFADRSARCKHCGATIRIPQPVAGGGDGQPAPVLAPPPPPPPSAGPPASRRFTPSPSASSQDQTYAMAVAAASVNRRAIERHSVLHLSFTHSGLGRVMATVAWILFIVAILAQLFTFWQMDWKDLRGMPFELAVSILALTLVPGSSLALLGLFSLAMGHILEYLARIATRTP